MSRLNKRISKNAAPKLKGAALAAVMKERVRSYHEWGRMNMGVQDLMKKRRLSLSAAYKANQFAKSYTVKELKNFLNLPVRKSGLPLHWGHIQYLLLVPVEKKTARKELQKAAVEQDWNPKELLVEIRKRFPRERGPGGRPRKNGLESKAFVPSLIAQVNDVESRVQQLDEKLRSGDLRLTQQRKSQLTGLDRAVISLGKSIRSAMRADTTRKRS